MNNSDQNLFRFDICNSMKFDIDKIEIKFDGILPNNTKNPLFCGMQSKIIYQEFFLITGIRNSNSCNSCTPGLHLVDFYLFLKFVFFSRIGVHFVF